MQRINVSKEDIDAAASEGLITHKDTGGLWQFLSQRSAAQLPATPEVSGQFDIAHLAWYSGSVIVLLALGWIMTSVWDVFSGGGIAVAAAVYAAGFIAVGSHLWKSKDLKVPGGLLFTLAVSMAPLFVFGVEKAAGWWAFGAGHEDLARWLVEASVVGAGFLALRFVRFPFLSAPITLGLWFLSLDLTQWLHGGSFSWDDQARLTMGFGLVAMAVSYVVDKVSKEDFAFWGYFFGVVSFWVSLTTLIGFGSNEAQNLLYAGINAVMMVTSVLIGRRVFVYFGALGVVGYIGHLSWSVFANSQLFPFVLSGIGLGVIFLGIKYQRNREAIENSILNLVPASMRSWLPQQRS